MLMNLCHNVFPINGYFNGIEKFRHFVGMDSDIYNRPNNLMYCSFIQ